MKKGIYNGLGMVDYHGWKLDPEDLAKGPISCSFLKRFNENPYAWSIQPEFRPTPAMELGSLFDAAVTDLPELDKLLPKPKHEDFIVLPFDNLRSKEAREWKSKKESEGKTVLTRSEADRAETELEEINALRERMMCAREMVYSHPIASRVMDGADCQVGLVGDYKGTPAKGLLDILPAANGDFGDYIFDYKTISTGISDHSVKNALGKFGYHMQAAFYQTLFNKLSPDQKRKGFGFIFQCVKTLEVRVVTLSTDSIAAGAQKVAGALDKFDRAVENGIQSQYLNSADELSIYEYHG